jgi:hypothetical protein
LLGVFFKHEDGHDMFLQDVGCLSAGYRVLNPRKRNLLPEQLLYCTE